MKEIKSLLLSVREKQIENEKFFGKGYNKSNQVFTFDDGKIMTGDYLTRKFAKLKKKYNIRNIRLHDLRHTCASILLSNGKLLKDVQEWLGHADMGMTANVYGHLDNKRKNDIGESMATLIPE